jgi:hypothetical protein
LQGWYKKDNKIEMRESAESRNEHGLLKKGCIFCLGIKDVEF